MNQVLKSCSHCQIPQSIENFSKDQKQTDQKCLWCKTCQKKQSETSKPLRRLREVKNRQIITENHRVWYSKNKEKVCNQRRINDKLRRQTDPQFKLGIILRNRMNHALNGHTKSAHTLELIGCSVDSLKQHIEKQFKTGMTWQNHGRGRYKWHIDHIIPCISFNLTDPEQQKKCFCYTNLQPLWEHENIAKHDKIL